jgi:uncharacterized membrane protein
MNTQTLLHLGLTVHLLALAMAVGVTIANAVASTQFWKLYDNNSTQGLSAFRAIKRFQTIGMIGLLLLIVSGIFMLWLYQGGFGGQLWFNIKMMCILLIFVNGVTLGRSTTLKLDKILKDENSAVTDTTRLRKHQRIFQVTQLSLFMIIIVLASFRFT